MGIAIGPNVISSSDPFYIGVNQIQMVYLGVHPLWTRYVGPSSPLIINIDTPNFIAGTHFPSGFPLTITACSGGANGGASSYEEGRGGGGAGAGLKVVNHSGIPYGTYVSAIIGNGGAGGNPCDPGTASSWGDPSSFGQYCTSSCQTEPGNHSNGGIGYGGDNKCQGGADGGDCQRDVFGNNGLSYVNPYTGTTYTGGVTGGLTGGGGAGAWGNGGNGGQYQHGGYTGAGYGSSNGGNGGGDHGVYQQPAARGGRVVIYWDDVVSYDPQYWSPEAWALLQTSTQPIRSVIDIVAENRLFNIANNVKSKDIDVDVLGSLTPQAKIKYGVI